jgi:uncharacterized protein (TIGR00266 family)
MNFSIDHRPEFAWLTIQVLPGQKLFVEASAMAAMTTNMSMKAKFKGGFRRLLSAESLFISEFTAEGGAGEVAIAPGPFGDLEHIALNGETIYLASSCYVAHTDGIQYETKFTGFVKSLLSGFGWFLIKMSGQGDVWFNGYGAVFALDVQDEILVDNNHVVAFSEGLETEIIRLGGFKSLFFSGEGFVVRFRGKGKVYLQTKKPSALIRWADGFRPVRNSKQ